MPPQAPTATATLSPPHERHAARPRPGQPLPSDRIESLDALRAGAMLAGIVLHSIAPYMHAPVRHLVMPLPEPAPTRAIDAVFWVIHAVRLPLFFFVSGLVSLLMLRRRGPKVFIRDRARRIVLPLLLTFFVLFPVMYFIWSWGWVIRGWGSWDSVRLFRWGPDVRHNVWGFFHLWFLAYLIIYALLLWALHRLNLTRLLGRVWIPALLFPLAAAWGAIDSTWFLDFHNTFVPERRPLVYYAAFFLWGASVAVRLQTTGRSLRQVTRAWPLFALFAAGACWVLLSMILPHTRMSGQGLCQNAFFNRPEDPPSARWEFAALLTITAASGTWFLVGAAAQFITRLNQAGRYLADASYWVYLTHTVWFGLAVMALHWLPWPPVAKAPVVMAITTAATLATFNFVRRTRLHDLIGTRLHPRPIAPAPASTPELLQTTEAAHSSQP